MLLCACSSKGTRTPEQHFAVMRFPTEDFVLHGRLKAGDGNLLHVYIEGDGLAYHNRTRPSDDPTPPDPVAFRLARSHPGSAPVLYLARPCQFVRDEDRTGCRRNDWTAGRMSERTLRAVDTALDQAKAATGVSRLALYGFSGGGGMAALLAQRRDDVSFLATVAGNLDHVYWTRYLKVAPLAQSLNPANGVLKTAHIPQLHVTGGADAIMPPQPADAWCAALPRTPCRRITVPRMTHEGPWDRLWPDLLHDAGQYK